MVNNNEKLILQYHSITVLLSHSKVKIQFQFRNLALRSHICIIFINAALINEKVSVTMIRLFCYVRFTLQLIRFLRYHVKKFKYYHFTFLFWNT